MKKRLRKKLAKTAGILLVTVFSLFCTACNKDFSMTVMLREQDGIIIKSENPVRVEYGGDASFSLLLPGSSDIIQVLCDSAPTEDYEYSDGILTVKNITSPTSIDVAAGKAGGKCVFFAQSSPSRGGGINTSVPQGRVEKGSFVTLTASPNDGAVFLGWSKDAALSKGGKLLSKTEQYTMKVNSDITVYANYDVSNVAKIVVEKPDLPEIKKPQKPQNSKYPQMKREKLVNITYASGDGNIYETDFCVDFYEMPNTLPEAYLPSKEGYLLKGYSTEPDGSGEFYLPGHKIPTNGKKDITLYCVWVKPADETDFEYTENSGNLTINKYKGNADELYIPKTIDGKPVVRIAQGAFTGSGISSVHIPSTVVTIDNGAFSDCSSLYEITIYDSLIQVSDLSFQNTKIEKLNIAAAKYPKYASSDLSFSKKYERLMSTYNKNRIIIVSGSSKHYGFVTPLADSLVDDSYAFVNYGTNAQMNIIFFLEAISHEVKKGDVIVYAPEQYGPHCYAVNGNPEFFQSTFQGIESCYNLMSNVDISKYTKVFDAYSGFAKVRSSMKEQSYEMYSRNTDSYGDCTTSRPNYNSETYRNGANGTFVFKDGTIPEEFVPNMNRVLDLAKNNGALCLLSYPPYNKNACDPSTLTEDGFAAYNSDMDKTVHAERISDAEDFIFEGKYFYNTDYHLNDEGARMHTLKTVEDFLGYGIGG